MLRPWIAVVGAAFTIAGGVALLVEPQNFSPLAYQYTFRQPLTREVWGWSFITVSVLFIGGMLAPRWRARRFTQHLLVGILAGALIALWTLWVLLLLLAKMDPAGTPISMLGVLLPAFLPVAIGMSWSRFGWGRQ